MQLQLKQIAKRERLIAFGIFAFVLLVFLLSRIHQVTDSRYLMLVSESLIHHRTFTLDTYNIPRYPDTWGGYYFRDGPIYQIEVARGHLYHHMPPGTPVLSAPYVAVLNAFGVSAANADGTYNEQGEVKIEASLAAILMALLAVVFFFTARLLLPDKWSVVIALGGALGTQVYSTASRALWSETWGILLIGIVIYFLLWHAIYGLGFYDRRLNPFLIATLLAWSYFVRPTFAIHIAAITIYLLLFYRRIFLKYSLTGAAWFAIFVLYSWSHFHQVLPSYYRASRLQFESFGIALAGNLVSPSRGFLIYVPVIGFVAYLLVRFWNALIAQGLAWLALSIIVLQLIVISGFSHWWGGHSFGPRLMTGVVPWLVLLAILGIDELLRRKGMLPTQAGLVRWRIELTAGGLLLLLSMFINTLGATAHATWLWNVRPKEIDSHPERLWDWRQPQFLAGYLAYPQPAEFPAVMNARIECGKPEAEKLFWYGLLQDEKGGCWTESATAIVFASAPDQNVVVRIHLSPFLAPGKISAQHLKIALNERPLTELTISDPAPQDYAISLPRKLLKERNVLKLEMPDAQSPQKAGTGSDPRPRALNIQWLEFGRE